MATHLADQSAIARIETSGEVREVMEPMVVSGRIAICGIVDLEVLFSATSPSHYKAVSERLAAMPRVPVTESIVERALEVQSVLATRSQHRSVTLPDLLVAACAEAGGLTVLHYDADFSRIAEITNQSVQWVVPAGSVN